MQICTGRAKSGLKEEVQGEERRMKLCGKDCTPCCDFCTHANHGTVVVDGKRVTTGPIGCKLHKDKEHQDIAATCGYCDDFVPVDSEITKK